MSSSYLRRKRIAKRLDLFGALGSKFLSVRALANVFDDWPNLLKIYFLGGHACIKIHDHNRNELPLEINQLNAARAISLGKIFGNSKNYELTNDMVNILFSGYRESFRLGEVLSGDSRNFDYFKEFCYLSSVNADLRPHDEAHYLVSLDGLTWFVRKAHEGDLHAGPSLSRTFEPYEYQSWFLPLLAHGGIFIDVGANVGGYTIRASKLGADVISLEPDKENFALLLRNVAANDCSRINAFNVAAGSSERKAALYAPDQDDETYAYTLIKQGRVRDYVDVKPLDDVVSHVIGDSKVQLTKIDVEGAELEVIDGALEVLKRTCYLMIEMWPGSKKRLFESLKRLDFKLVDVGRSWRGPSRETNLLFKKT